MQKLFEIDQFDNLTVGKRITVILRYNESTFPSQKTKSFLANEKKRSCQ